MSDKALHVTSANFEAEVLKATGPVLVDFWATWCPPCRMIAPAVEELAGEFAGKAKVAKLDVDKYPALATQYRVQSLPTLLYFAQGEVRQQVIGAASKRTILSQLDTLVTTAA